ncbi:hypothetical protein [Mesorhizobium sp. M0909]|uniref:hypothetical protein n=1 Tax=Mesorhizobium sp. M0909 TaxID=2957024 RepID=UPI003339B335
MASRVSCFVHGCGLRDRCPACHAGIVAPDQADLIPQHFCARCGFDLRRAPKVSVKTAARRLERSIDDICKVEMAKGSTTIGDLTSRLLRAPYHCRRLIGEDADKPVHVLAYPLLGMARGQARRLVDGR